MPKIFSMRRTECRSLVFSLNVHFILRVKWLHRMFDLENSAKISAFCKRSPTWKYWNLSEFNRISPHFKYQKSLTKPKSSNIMIFTNYVCNLPQQEFPLALLPNRWHKCSYSYLGFGSFQCSLLEKNRCSSLNQGRSSAQDVSQRSETTSTKGK